MRGTKPKAEIRVADGKGGLVSVLDQRFKPLEGGEIEVSVPAGRAATWQRYLSREIHRRGWGSRGLSQNEANESSGSLTVDTNGADDILLIWRKPRDAPMIVRARSVATPDEPSSFAQELMAAVTELCELGVLEDHRCFGILAYTGYPWRGELWLEDGLRLGQPALEDGRALSGPRVILVDWLISAIDRNDAWSQFRVRLRQLSVFLSVVLRLQVNVPDSHERVWIHRDGADGQIQSTVEDLGYEEPRPGSAMPSPGEFTSTPLTLVERPDFERYRPGDALFVPEDIVELWGRFVQLAESEQQHFLRAGNLWQAALSLMREHQTTALSLMVVACEALKPAGPAFRDRNAFHVVEALFGSQRSSELQDGAIAVLSVRDTHLHLGKIWGNEFENFADAFDDPSFMRLESALFYTSAAAITEFLRSGPPPVEPRPRKSTWVDRLLAFFTRS